MCNMMLRYKQVKTKVTSPLWVYTSMLNSYQWHVKQPRTWQKDNTNYIIIQVCLVTESIHAFLMYMYYDSLGARDNGALFSITLIAIVCSTLFMSWFWNNFSQKCTSLALAIACVDNPLPTYHLWWMYLDKESVVNSPHWPSQVLTLVIQMLWIICVWYHPTC